MLAIFMAQQLIVAFTEVTRGNIPASFVFKFIVLNLPNTMQFFLQFALFIGVLLTFIRMYHNQEIIAMFACGVPYTQVVKSLLAITSLVASFSLVNNLYLSPILLTESKTQIQYYKSNPTFSLIKEGSFTNIPGTDYIIFLNEVDKNIARSIFLFNLDENHKLQFIYAQQGKISQQYGQRVITLTNGNLFTKDINQDLINEINQLPQQQFAEFKKQVLDSLSNASNLANNKQQLLLEANSLNPQVKAQLDKMNSDFYYVYFKELTLKVPVEEQEQDSLSAYKYKTAYQLWDEHKYPAYLEIVLRIISALSIYLLVYIAFIFGKINARQGRNSNIIIAISLYLIYTLSLNSLKSVVSKGGNIFGVFYIFIAVNLIYILLSWLLSSERPAIKNNKAVILMRKFFGV